MSHVIKQSVQHIEMGEDWVELRLPVLYGLRSSMRDKLAALRVNESGYVQPGDPQLAAANLDLLLGTIVAWGGTGFCSLADHDAGEKHDGACVPLAITAEVINTLDEIAERILFEIETRNKSGSPDFTKPSMPPSGSGAQADSTSNASPTSTSSNEPAGAGSS